MGTSLFVDLFGGGSRRTAANIACDVGPCCDTTPGLVLYLNMVREVADSELLVPGKGDGGVWCASEVAF